MKLRNKKTGEIIKDAQYRNYSTRDGFVISTPTDSYSYKSLKEFCEDWEDAEDINVTNIPLIEDEKIRRCVKLWTELNGYGHSLMYAEGYGWCSFYELLDDEELLFRNCSCSNLQNRRVYTITELCGDEEAPEPIEPKFIDLDERVKEKGEE